MCLYLWVNTLNRVYFILAVLVRVLSKTFQNVPPGPQHWSAGSGVFQMFGRTALPPQLMQAQAENTPT